MTYIEFKNSRDHFTVDEYANAKTVEELEKIKAEINEQIDFNESCCERTDLYEAIGIINRRIAELKGENNDTTN